MIRYIYGAELHAHPKLRATMFLDRAEQFKIRQGWDVTLDENGFEVDQYDMLNPLYAIWETPNGNHGGSIRVLPTIGRTMVNEHFTQLTDGVSIRNPLIWECTRFCISPNLDYGRQGEVAAALILAGCELGVRFGLRSAIGIIYARTLPIYTRIGWLPEIIGRTGTGRDEILACLWPINVGAKFNICKKSNIRSGEVENWFDSAFPINPTNMAIAA